MAKAARGSRSARTPGKKKKARTQTPAARAAKVADKVVKAGAPATLKGAAVEIPGVKLDERISWVSIDKLKFDPANRRDAGKDGDEGLAELAGSIKRDGVLNPVIATRDGLVVVAGERRVRAARLAKLATVPVRLGDFEDRASVIAVRAIENVQRRAWGPIEEVLVVVSFVELAEKEVRRAEGLKPDAELELAAAKLVQARAVKLAAQRLGKAEGWVNDRLYVSRLGKRGRELVATGKLPLGHARLIASLHDARQRESLAERAAADRYSEWPMDLEDLKQIVGDELHSLGSVRWQLDVEFAGGPACTTCPANSANVPGLFEGRTPDGSAVPKAGVCTRPECFKKKSAATNRAMPIVARKFVALTKSAGKDKSKIKPDGATVAPLAPAFVSPAAAVEACREASSSKPRAASSSSSHRHAPARGPKQVARDQAENRLRTLTENRSRDLHKAVCAKLEEQPLLYVLELLLRNVPKYHDCDCNWNRPAQGKALASPSVVNALAVFRKPVTLETIRELLDLVGKPWRRETSNGGRHEYRTVEWQDAVAKAYAIELPSLPKLGDLVEEELAKTAGAKSARAAKGKATAENDDADEGDVEEPADEPEGALA